MVDYTNRLEIVNLGLELYGATQHVKIPIIVTATLEGLMYFPWPVRIVSFFVGKERVARSWMRVMMDNEDIAERAWKQLVTHVVEGKDTYDPKSAGGLCKEEMAVFVAILAQHGFY